jgi:hypothetical protein
MKNLILYVALCIVCVCMLYGCAKATSQTHTTSVSVLVDKTDTMQSLPDPLKMDGLYDFTSDIWNGAYFSYAPITDVDFNQRQSVVLSSDNLWSGNELKRKREIEKYLKAMDSILEQSGEIKAGRLHSSIYRTVINELARMQTEQVDKRTLLIYSDLQENSDLYNIYTSQGIDKLLSRPEQVKAIFEKAIPIPDLKGIKIYILFEPKTQEDNRVFNSMSSIYKNILAAHGATVFIQSNL